MTVDEALAIVVLNDVITPQPQRCVANEKTLEKARYIIEQVANAAVKAESN